LQHFIYHITHKKNLPPIIRGDGLSCDSKMAGGKCVTIGYQSLKDRRAEKLVNVSKGGTLADYVPFYFAPRSPMLYRISRGSVDSYKGGQAPIIYLVSTVEDVNGKGIPFFFTDGHAVMELSEQYEAVSDLNKVDWRVLEGKYWYDTDQDGDRSRRRQAEFLVHDFFPWSLVQQVVVINSEMKKCVENMIDKATHKPKVVVNSAWYY
jgi:hypothetical protein